jgi:hypothetical protein
MQKLFENWRGFLTEEKVPTINSDVLLDALESLALEVGQDALLAAKSNSKELAKILDKPLHNVYRKLIKTGDNIRPSAPAFRLFRKSLQGPIAKAISRYIPVLGYALIAKDIYDFFIAENNIENIREFHDSIAGLLGLPTYKEQPCWKNREVKGFPKCRDS